MERKMSFYLACQALTQTEVGEMFIQLNIQAILNTLNKDVFKEGE